jgi:hypothetical protein
VYKSAINKKETNEEAKGKKKERNEGKGNKRLKRKKERKKKRKKERKNERSSTFSDNGIVTDSRKCGSIATQRPGETLLYPR